MGLFRSTTSTLSTYSKFSSIPKLPFSDIQSFPETLLKSPPRSLADLQYIYTHSHPLYSAFLLVVWNSAWTWLASEITGNLSQVDRVWTFLPVMYTIHFTFQPLIAHYLSLASDNRPPITLKNYEEIVSYILAHTDHRQLLMLATQLFWSARLSFNAYRRGFFHPNSEDYRWEVLRDKVPKFLLKIFNILFIAIAQNVLLLGIALPSYYLLVQSNPTLYSSALSKKDAQALKTNSGPTRADWVLAGACVACVIGEYLSDGIQQAYQSWKHTPDEKRAKTKTWTVLPFGLGPKSLSITWGETDLRRGFVSEGLWSYSRHPAFALEQSFWLLQGLFPLVHLSSSVPSGFRQLRNQIASSDRPGWELIAGSATSVPWWPFAGALGLMSLFIASTLFTEYITSPKYPAYKRAYQRRVGMFWPLDTYLKRIWLSCTDGNFARRKLETELGWSKTKRD
ncbi:Predicted steroid reductase [Phaffia rhodozyma]|uniref:Predicted steroid reductase n=1 Tax=Phaffia rhodozyma TaxID=264483 RepID=A0A0F7SIA8_PHARH|nr:Predicted steroid reductase [Phaffia rhodozyma]